MIFKNWLEVLAEPRQVFAEEKANASLKKALIIIFVAGIISGIFYIIGTYIWFLLLGKLMTFSSPYPISYGDFFGTPLSLPEYLALSYIVYIIGTPIAFLVQSGILYVFAKLFKGKGNFTTQTYLFALLSAPCMIIISALNIIPFIGGILGLLVVVYELYLLTLALKETHQYSTGKAVLTWLMPFIVLAILMFVVIIAMILSSGFIMS